MHRSFCHNFTALLILLIATLFFFVPDVRAEFNNESDPDFWKTIEAVRTMASYQDTLYIGGDFVWTGPYAEGMGLMDMSDYSVDQNFPQPDSSITSAVSDGNGGWYVGGGFNYLGSRAQGEVARSNLAHILADDTIDPAFNPNVNGSVLSMVLSPDRSILYIGGSFTAVGTGGDLKNRNRIAAISTATGLATDWDPNADNTVRKLRINSAGTVVYAMGLFTTIGGQSRSRLSGLDTSANTNNATAFNPAPNANVYDMEVTNDGSVVYTSGDFTTIGGQTRNRIAALNSTNGTATAWNPDANNRVQNIDLSPDNTVIYAAGRFTTIGGQSRSRIAALSTATGNATAFTVPGAPLDDYNALEVSPDGSQLFALGGWGPFDIQGKVSYDILHISTATGEVLDPEIGCDDCGGSLSYAQDEFTFNEDGSKVLVFTTWGLGGRARWESAAFDMTTGQITDFAPRFNGAVLDMEINADGSILYVAGDFLSTNGANQAYVAAINTADSTLIASFDPSPTNLVTDIELSPDGQTLYMSGIFNQVGHAGGNYQARNGAAAVNTADGTLTPWQPANTGSILDFAFSPDGTVLYMSGTITVNGQPRRLAAVDPITGASGSWDPNPNNNVNKILISADGTKAYIGGFFTTVNGVSRLGLAVVDTSTGDVSDWDAHLSGGGVEDIVLNQSETKLFIGGNFQTVDGYSRLGTAILDTTANSNNLYDWNPNFNFSNSDGVYSLSLSPDESHLYVGGYINQVAENIGTSITRLYGFARFTDPDAGSGPAPTPTPEPTAAPTPEPTSQPTTTPTPTPGPDVLGACTLEKPASPPNLFQINTKDTSATLYFTTATNPVTKHFVGYGVLKNISQYLTEAGIGFSRGAVTYTINNLEASTEYSFAVRGANDCAAGNWSQTVTTTTNPSGDEYVTENPQVPPEELPFEPVEEEELTVISNVIATPTSPTTTVITWTTSDEATTGVDYGPQEEGYTDHVSDPALTTEHAVTVEHLHPHTTYTYQVISEGKSIAVDAGRTFTTTPDSTTGGSGNGNGGSNAYTPPQPHTPEVLTKVTETVSTIVAPFVPPIAALQEKVTETVSNLVEKLPEPVKETAIKGMEVVREMPLPYSVNPVVQVVLLAGVVLIMPKSIIDIGQTLLLIKDTPVRLLQGWYLFLAWIGLKKKYRPWGLVYDSLTKQPIDPAIVSLFSLNKDKGKDKESKQDTISSNEATDERITDFEGRFGFIVTPGTYKLLADKTDYVFPSKVLKGAKDDGERENLYFGEDLKVTNPDSVIVSIPLDPKGFNWNQANKPVQYQKPKLLLKNSVINALNIFGLVVSIGIYILIPSLLNFFLMVVYVTIFTLRELFGRPRKWGTVYSKATNTVLPLVRVQSIREDGLKEGSCLTDHLGRYFILLTKGKHFLQVEQTDSSNQTKVLAKVGPITVRDNNVVIAPNIAV